MKANKGLKPKVKKKWLEALRSGKYKQGSNRLCVEDSNGNKSFCCLGVLCDIHRKTTKKKANKWKKEGGSLTYKNVRFYLPQQVVDWAFERGSELARLDPSVEKDGVRRKLSVLNDNGLSFEEIAKSISKSL